MPLRGRHVHAGDGHSLVPRREAYLGSCAGLRPVPRRKWSEVPLVGPHLRRCQRLRREADMPGSSGLVLRLLPVACRCRGGRLPARLWSHRSVTSAPNARELRESAAHRAAHAAQRGRGPVLAAAQARRPPRTSSSASSPPPIWTRSGAATSQHVLVGGLWLYLACVLDICSRPVIDYSMASHMRTELVIDALTMAAATRGGRVDGVIFMRTAARSTRQRVRAGLRRLRDPQEHGPGRLEQRQRRRRVILAGAQEGDGAPATVLDDASVETGGLPVAHLLHPRTRHSGLNYLSPGGFEQQHQRGRKLTLAALPPVSTLRGTPHRLIATPSRRQQTTEAEIEAPWTPGVPLSLQEPCPRLPPAFSRSVSRPGSSGRADRRPGMCGRPPCV